MYSIYQPHTKTLTTFETGIENQMPLFWSTRITGWNDGKFIDISNDWLISAFTVTTCKQIIVSNIHAYIQGWYPLGFCMIICHIYWIWTKQGGICETRKGPNRLRFEGVLNISYTIMFRKKTLWSILAKFSYFSGGWNCQKAHLHIKIFDLSL